MSVGMYLLSELAKEMRSLDRYYASLASDQKIAQKDLDAADAADASEQIELDRELNNRHFEMCQFEMFEMCQGL